ncbi:MAG: histidine--tRNA ligase [Pirellula sp.]
MSLIEPRTLKGFRDFLPAKMVQREKLMDTAKRVYRRYGFLPIDTPALEYLEILTGKGSEETDRQMYHFIDAGGRPVGMRFDLTVPLARFSAQHINELGTPFKRYHIAPVWRGENPQDGRFREFVQCDFDTIGTTGVVSDIETALVIHELLLEIGIDQFRIRINNRQILTGLLEMLDLKDQSTAVLRALDKLDKVGVEGVSKEMAQAGIQQEQADKIFEFAQIKGSHEDVLSQLSALLKSNELASQGIDRLSTVSSALQAAGVPPFRFEIDVSIARGLDYYTGIIFETTLLELPRIGSVCSGGRYDNLAGLFTKQQLPGIGASLGLDRLLAALEKLGRLEESPRAADVFIPLFDPERMNDYFALAALVRSNGISAEVYPEPKKLGQQLKYADQRGFLVALIAGARELDQGLVQIKDLRTQTATEVAWRDQPDGFLAALHSILGLGSMLSNSE